MITICDSITEISKKRFNNKASAFVPSYQFKCTVGGVPLDVTVVLPNYKNAAIRLISEFIDGMRLSIDAASSFAGAIKDIYAKRSLSVVVEGYYPELEELCELRNSDNEYGVPDLPVFVLNALSLFAISLGGRIFLSNISVEVKDTLDVETLNTNTLDDILASMYDKEVFLNNYKELSSNGSVCSVGSRVIYPEDVFNTPFLSLDYTNKYTHNMYASYQKLSDVLNNGDYTDGQRALFEKTICSCGGDLVMHTSDMGLTNLTCINPHCKHKMLWGLAGLVRDIGVLGAGAKSFSDAVEMVWFNNITTYGLSKVLYSEIIGEDFGRYLGGSLKERYVDFLQALTDYNGTTKNLIKISGLPYLGEYAGDTITKKNIKTIFDFEGLLTVCKNSKIKDMRVTYNLYTYLNDLEFLLDSTKSVDNDDVWEFNVCITHNVRLDMGEEGILPFTKTEFIQYLNDYLKANDPDKHVLIVLKKSMSRGVHVLINDNNEESIKNSTARAYGIPIIKSNQIFEALKSASAIQNNQ